MKLNDNQKTFNFMLSNFKIAEKKMQDLNAADMDAAVKIISGSARSIGIEVID